MKILINNHEYDFDTHKDSFSGNNRRIFDLSDCSTPYSPEMQSDFMPGMIIDTVIGKRGSWGAFVIERTNIQLQPHQPELGIHQLGESRAII